MNLSSLNKFDPCGALWLALAIMLVAYTVTSDACEARSDTRIAHVSVDVPSSHACQL
jgi:hypothetical protein